jgi:hypothetical protein
MKILAILLNFLLMLTFLSNLAIAQGLTAEEIYAISVILLVIVAIIIAAGWKMRVRFPASLVIFGLIVLFLVVLPFFVKIPEEAIIPKTWKLTKLPEFMVRGMTYLGFPRDWGYVPAFIYLVIIPFAAILAIVWGFLNQLRIFDKKVVRVLSLLIAFSTIPVGIFSKMVYFYFAISGFIGISAFVAVFVLGTILIGTRGVGVQYAAVESIRTLNETLLALRREYDKLAEQLRKENLTPEQVKQINDKMYALETRMAAIQNRIKNLITTT